MLGRTFTIAMILITLAIVATITASELMEWHASSKRTPTTSGKGEELLGVFSGQAPIGVVLVALGVILEGRHTFVRKVLKIYRLEHLPGQEEFSDTCELFGFYILVLGLLSECFGELVKFYGMYYYIALIIFGAMSIVLNLIAIIFLLQLIVK